MTKNDKQVLLFIGSLFVLAAAGFSIGYLFGTQELGKVQYDYDNLQAEYNELKDKHMQAVDENWNLRNTLKDME